MFPSRIKPRKHHFVRDPVWQRMVCVNCGLWFSDLSTDLFPDRIAAWVNPMTKNTACRPQRKVA